MSELRRESLRNVAMISSAGAGKTSLVEAMRPTVQTSQYLEKLGPFFVGRALWRSKLPEPA